MPQRPPRRRTCTTRRTASGRPTAATCTARATRRSTRSTPDNFNKLEVAWRFKTDNLGPRPEYQLQAHAADGRTACSTSPPARAAPSSRSMPRPARCCGCTARTKGKRGEVGAAPALGPRPRLLDRRQGRPRSSTSRPATSWSRSTRRPGDPVPTFGKNGIVDLKPNDDQEMDLDHRRDRPARGADRREERRHHRRRAPARAASPKSKTNEKGYVRGFDVRTGKRLWIFHTIPRPGEFGNDTWEGDSWAYTGNTGVVGADERGRGARPRLPAGRAADRRLLRRSSSRRRPVRREPRRAST